MFKSTPSVMGILNVTPDSYYDGGQYTQIDHALKHTEQMLQQGADIIDIGGESTRPGAEPVSVEDELKRVVPLVEAIKKRFDTIISVDTRQPAVMQAVLERGADMINDVQALGQEGSLEIVAKYKPYLCLMHMLGAPKTMQEAPEYDDVVGDIKAFLQEKMSLAIQAGIPKSKIILDPGFGFGKTLKHNLTLLNHLNEFKSLEAPLLIGISRKSMFEHLLGLKVEDRLFATLGATSIALWQGADIIRTHDVKATKDCLLTVHAIKTQGQ